MNSARLALAAALSLASLVAVPPASAASAAAGVTAQNEIERPILRELNRVRAAHSLRRLRPSVPLHRAADFHAASMGRRGYFSHTSIGGTTFDRRIARFYPSRSTSRWLVGENLLWGSELGAREAVRAWMSSPGHRANILRAGFREIGIAAVRVKGARGLFGGGDVTIVVTNFGSR